MTNNGTQDLKLTKIIEVSDVSSIREPEKINAPEVIENSIKPYDNE